MLALPEASNCTVRFCVIAVGAVMSSTVTVADTVAKFPSLSVTVKFTVLSPRLAHVKLSISSTNNSSLVGVQLSVVPLSTSEGKIDALPDPFN